MPGTFFGLSIGTSGLYASQAGLNTTSHNISNIETLGYSKQVANQQASDALRMNASYGMVGTGVNITGITQLRNAYYDEKYRFNNTISGSYSTKEYYMNSIENYFNEVRLEGFTKNFDSMYDTLQELSKNPMDLTVRTQTSIYAQSVTEYVNSLATSLEGIQTECNFEVRNQVNRINSLSQQIATITKQINTLEVGKGTANDLRDQRNLMVEELSTFGNISVEERVIGDGVGINTYTVKLDGQLLVDTYENRELQVIPREEKVDSNDVDGLYDIYWKSGQKLDVTSPTLGGTLQALFEVRDGNNSENFKGKATAKAGDTSVTLTSTNKNSEIDLNIPQSGVLTIGNREYEYDGFAVLKDPKSGEIQYEFSLKEPIVTDTTNISTSIGESIQYKGIPYYMSQLNRFVRTYAKAYNDIHKSGYDLDGNKGMDFFNGTDRVTGKNYAFATSPTDEKNGYLFTSKSGKFAGGYDKDSKNYASYYFMTAKNFSVSKEIMDDPKKLVTSTTIGDGAGNNDIVDKLIKLKDDVTMFSQGKPAQFFQSLMAEIGIDTKKTTNFAKNQKDILVAVDNQRLSICGVDSEEEAMQLIRYQNAYGLSAKSITVMDECLDRLINYMGA